MPEQSERRADPSGGREPARRGGAPASEGGPPAPRGGFRWFWLLFVALLLINWVLAGTLTSKQAQKQLSIPYSVSYARVTDKNVQSITFTGNRVTGVLRKQITYEQNGTPETSKEFTTEAPFPIPNVTYELIRQGAVVGRQPDDELDAGRSAAAARLRSDAAARRAVHPADARRQPRHGGRGRGAQLASRSPARRTCRSSRWQPRSSSR